MAATIFLGVSVVAMVAYYIWDINKLTEEWYNWEDIRDEAF